MKVEYTREETDAMILDAHVARFGALPTGMKWEVSRLYGTLIIESVRDKSVEPMAELPQESE